MCNLVKTYKKYEYRIITPHLVIKALYFGNADVTVSTSSRIGDLCAVKSEITNSEKK